MSNMIVMAPAAVSAIGAIRGDGVANLLTPDPLEVWADTASGSEVRISLNLGTVRPIDTVFLGHAAPLPPDATWRVQGGPDTEFQFELMATRPMRVTDPASSIPTRSHALWHGPVRQVRHLRITINQPAAASPISIGTLMVGKAFVPRFNREHGAGRGVIDTGSTTPLANGGYAVVEGKRKGSFAWSFGDLDAAEVDALYELQLQCGDTSPVLVVEDPDATAGQFHRIHYARFAALKQYKRRNAAQTRWEMEIEHWG